MTPYRTPAPREDEPPAEDSWGPDTEERRIAWLWLITGLLPFAGLWLVGTWSDVELGIGGLLALVAGHTLIREYVRALRARLARRGPALSRVGMRCSRLPSVRRGDCRR